MRETVKGDQRKVHNRELQCFYSLPSKVWVMKLRRKGWLGHASGRRNARKVLKRKTDGKSFLGRPRHRCEDNIKMNLRYQCMGGRY
jgi:hypothetical protein